MAIWLGIEFWLLAIISTWMTASAITALRGRAQKTEEMNNLYEQVIGALRAGDLPRAILLLEGEPGPLARLLSSLLTESTKLSPKLRVAYKITLESLKRQGQLAVTPLRAVGFIAPLLGLLGMVASLIAALFNATPYWAQALWLLLLSVVISGISWLFLYTINKADKESIAVAGDYGRKLLNILLSPDSPLISLRGHAFPIED